ncbi:MAG TPA: BatA domain-containing protein, partial [Myxococcaceae bacterium]|nr:BatA domain-containing protein [Myxococcaceae bacterium]
MLPDLLWHDPRALWLLLLVPVVGFLSWREQRRRAALRFSATQVLAAGPRGARARLQSLLPVLRMAALVLAVLALARPQTHGARTRDLSVEGIDIVIALDVSQSMSEADLPPDRITVARKVIDDFITRRPYDRIGLVIFGKEAFTQCPLTLDHRAVRSLLADVRLG